MARLLLVDDDNNIRQLYSLMLSEEGHDVEVAASASEAEKKLTYNNYDLLLLDIKLKNECGLDLLQKIRQRHDLPVVLCSAYSCYKDDFTSWLADGYVVKSSDPQKLMGEIARVLAKKNISLLARFVPSLGPGQLCGYRVSGPGELQAPHSPLPHPNPVR